MFEKGPQILTGEAKSSERKPLAMSAFLRSPGTSRERRSREMVNDALDQAAKEAEREKEKVECRSSRE